jgi:hypothetical protein
LFFLILFSTNKQGDRKMALTRRQFILISGTTLVSAGLVPQALLASETQPTIILSFLTPAEAEAVLTLSRLIYPHSFLEDEHYLQALQSLDEKASNDAALGKTLKDGAALLAKQTSIALTDTIQQAPIFQSLRGHLVVALYNNKNVWPLFGYEGPSFPKGGYLHRGFNDINWLPKS